MVWVAMGVVAEMHERFGTFAADEWSRFARILGLRWLFADLPDWLPAYRAGDLIVISRDMTPEWTAWWVWHEIGHWVMHPGTLLRPLGYPNVGKQERQADDFAQLFPAWDTATFF